MKTAIIVIVVILLSPSLVGFGLAAYASMSGATRRRERSEAMRLWSEVPANALAVVRRVYRAFVAGDVKEANRQTRTHRSEVTHVIKVLTQPRSAASSAGAMGDSLNLTVSRQALTDQGYSRNAAALIAAIQHHHLDDLLEEIEAIRATDSAEPGRMQDSTDVPNSVTGIDGEEDSSGLVPLPDWLEQKATDAPTMVRVVIDVVDARLRREYPQVRSCPEWHRFRELGTIAGCGALATRLALEVPQAYCARLEVAMLDALELAFPGSRVYYRDCGQSVVESLPRVERSKRGPATFVFLSMWVLGKLDSDGSLLGDSRLAADLGAVYLNESAGYWTSGETE